MIRIGFAVLRRPDLWVTAARQARRTAPCRWWRRRPFLPVPSAGYLQFRLVTQYGDAHTKPVPRDAIRYLEWCRAWNRS